MADVKKSGGIILELLFAVCAIGVGIILVDKCYLQPRNKEMVLAQFPEITGDQSQEEQQDYQPSDDEGCMFPNAIIQDYPENQVSNWSSLT